jgi:hypothetical protein
MARIWQRHEAEELRQPKDRAVVSALLMRMDEDEPLDRARLPLVRGLGRRRISEIGTALAFAGLVVTGIPPRPGRIREPESGKAAE